VSQVIAPDADEGVNLAANPFKPGTAAGSAPGTAGPGGFDEVSLGGVSFVCVARATALDSCFDSLATVVVSHTAVLLRAFAAAGCYLGSTVVLLEGTIKPTNQPNSSITT
jgi:hypothetical protein